MPAVTVGMGQRLIDDCEAVDIRAGQYPARLRAFVQQVYQFGSMIAALRQVAEIERRDNFLCPMGGRRPPVGSHYPLAHRCPDIDLAYLDPGLGHEGVQHPAIDVD